MQKEIINQDLLPGTSVSFGGSVSEIYEQVLGKFLFEPYATDLVQSIDKSKAFHVLELACGTGQVTKKLLQQLPSSTHITATDMESEMLEVAKKHINDRNVTWNIVDMMNIPYDDGQFDLIICQFGLMLVSDKRKALQEMYRVLQPGGELIFSVWGNLEENRIWKIGSEVLNVFLDKNPVTQNPGPFSMNEEETLKWLRDICFKNATATTVIKTGEIQTAALAAEGFIRGLPVSFAIKKKDPSLLPKIEKALELELIKQLGNNPLLSPLTALKFKAIK